MSHLVQTAGVFIDNIKINSNKPAVRDGRTFWVKHRRGWGSPIAHCANGFFRAVQNPVHVFSRRADWQRWEIESFNLLHAEEGFQAFPDGGDTVWIEQMPGCDLWTAATRGTLSDRMLAAAGRELRRAHAIPCAELNGRWSHGDPHLGNFIFDFGENRARLIDFEVVHSSKLTETERHADDLLVFLQDLMGNVDGERWPSAVDCFLRHYSEAPGLNGVFPVLAGRIAPPKGVSRVWWSIRTDYIAKEERNKRLAALREILDGERKG